MMSKSICPASEYLTLPAGPSLWIVKGLIPYGGSLLLYGAAKTGKSYAAIQLAAAVAQGKDWFGFPTVMKTRTVYLQLDTPRSIWQDRLKALAAYGITLDDVFVADRESLPFPFSILNEDHRKILRDSLAEIKPELVIVDTLRKCHFTDENDSTAMQAVTDHLIATILPAALVIISHARKPHGEDAGLDLINDNRGSNYLSGQVDGIAAMTARTLHYTGRAIEGGTVRLRKVQIDDDHFIWEVDPDEVSKALEEIRSNPSLTTKAAQARELSTMLGRSEEACRKLLARHSPKD